MVLSTILASAKTGLTYIWKYREVAMALIIGVLLYLLLNRPPIPSPETIIDPLTLQQLKQERDINGQLMVIIKQTVVEKHNQGKTIDSLAKALKIKPKFIQGATIVKTVIDTIYKDTGSTKLVIVDGDTAHLVQHKDPWVDIKAYAYTNPKNWHLDHIDFKLTDSLYFIQTHKNPLFGRPTDEIIVRSANPSNHIVAGSSYKVREKIPWLSIGVGGGYQLLPTTTWSVGFYAIYPIFSLKR